jgi:hypothetical protein
MVGGLGQKYTKYLAGSVLRNCEMDGGIAVGQVGRLVGRVIVSDIIFFSFILSAFRFNWVLYCLLI